MSETFMKYVAGFMFNEDKTEVALIRKNKPAWQKGLLNGIGGKIEDNEQPEEAMVREFMEETGCLVGAYRWRYFARLVGPQFSVDFFATIGDLSQLESPEDEKVEHVRLAAISVLGGAMIENLPWLISLAIDHLTDGRPNFVTANYP